MERLLGTIIANTKALCFILEGVRLVRVRVSLAFLENQSPSSTFILLFFLHVKLNFHLNIESKPVLNRADG